MEVEFIQDIKSNKKLIIFLPACGAKAIYYKPFLNMLSSILQNFNILYIGQFGFAPKHDKIVNFSLEEHSFIINLQISNFIQNYEEVIIIAHSLGCYFAVEAKKYFGNKINNIILIAPFF